MELYHSYDKLEKMYGKQPTFNTYLHKLADSYINGEDLGDFDIEELENTPDFMMNVIYSSRKNDKYDYTAILKLCGEDVKKSYAVASTCLFRFYDRPEVISKVCKDFISLNKTGDLENDYLNEKTTEILVRTVRILKEDKKILKTIYLI